MAKYRLVFGFLLVALLFSTSVLALAQDQEPVTLRFAWWGNPTRDERTLKVIELFQEQYPWITIEPEPSKFEDHWIALQGQGEAGNLPDLIQQDYSRLQLWVDNGWLLPLDEFVEDGTIDLSDVAETNLSGGRVNEQLYAVSLGTNSNGYVLDVDAFAEAGLEVPKQDWTWKDFEDICLALHEKLDKWCIGDPYISDDVWRTLALSYGETPYAADNKSLGFSEDQPLIDFFNMALRLQEAGAIPSRSDVIAIGGLIENEPIIESKAVMANIWSNQLVALWTAAGEDRQFVMIHRPRTVDGCCASNYVKPSQFLSIGANSEHPQEAAMFINFFTNSLEANRILLAERGVPVSSVVQEDLKDYISSAQAEAFAFLSRTEGDSSPLPPPDAAAGGTIRDTLYIPILLDSVLFGEMTPEDGVALFREEANNLLAGE